MILVFSCFVFFVFWFDGWLLFVTVNNWFCLKKKKIFNEPWKSFLVSITYISRFFSVWLWSRSLKQSIIQNKEINHAEFPRKQETSSYNICIFLPHMLYGNKLCVLYLLEVALHARHQHDAGHTNSQKQKKGVDEASHCRVVFAGAATTQQAGGAAAQARDLGGIAQRFKIKQRF